MVSMLSINELENLGKAISDKSRIRYFSLITKCIFLNTMDIVKITGEMQQNVTRHLNYLKRCGVIDELTKIKQYKIFHITSLGRSIEPLLENVDDKIIREDYKAFEKLEKKKELSTSYLRDDLFSNIENIIKSNYKR